MSLKELLGIKEAGISEFEIVKRIQEADEKNLDFIELNVEGDVVKIDLPHLHLRETDDRCL